MAPFLIRHVPFFGSFSELASCRAQDLQVARELPAGAADCQVQAYAHSFPEGQPGVHGTGNQGRDVAAGVQGVSSS